MLMLGDLMTQVIALKQGDILLGVFRVEEMEVERPTRQQSSPRTVVPIESSTLRTKNPKP